MAHLADSLKEKGNQLFKAGDYTGAEAQYTAAITKYSRNPLLFTNRAFARIKLQRWEGVVDDCLHSIEITGGQGYNYKAYFYLGKLPSSVNPFSACSWTHTILRKERARKHHKTPEPRSRRHRSTNPRNNPY